MIEYLRGKVLRADGGHVVLDVGGVGYGLDVPSSTLDRLPSPGSETELHVSLVVREDALDLYGFRTPEEKRVFEIFLTVSGIGPRTALDVLSSISIPDFVSAIRLGRIEELTRVPGIGRKKAERLIVELKDRLKDFPVVPASSGDETMGEITTGASQGSLYDDAVAAMLALGYKPAVAARCVTAALRSVESEDVPVETLVKLALQMSR
jgi:holliday junction DNA helicase RuvA